MKQRRRQNLLLHSEGLMILYVSSKRKHLDPFLKSEILKYNSIHIDDIRYLPRASAVKSFVESIISEIEKNKKQTIILSNDAINSEKLQNKQRSDYKKLKSFISKKSILLKENK